MPKLDVRSAIVALGMVLLKSVYVQMDPVMLHRSYQQRKHHLPCNFVPLIKSCFDVSVTIWDLQVLLKKSF